MPSRLSPTALLAIIQPWGDVAEPIHRRLEQLVDAGSGQDVLLVGCGSGRSVLWWAERFDTHIEGVDPDAAAVERAETAARKVGLGQLATFQSAAPTDLPHEERVFDLVVVHMLHLHGDVGAEALKEAARVTRPMGTVAAVVPTWLRTPDPADVHSLATLGIHPHLLVEWKGYCREAGLVELAVEEAAQEAGWFAAGWLGLLVRAWRAAGWAGIYLLLSREFRAFRSLSLRRGLGLSVVKGTRWPHDS